jgi:hypothetical protein
VVVVLIAAPAAAQSSAPAPDAVSPAAASPAPSPGAHGSPAPAPAASPAAAAVPAVNGASDHAALDRHADGVALPEQLTNGRKMYLADQGRPDIHTPMSWAVMAYKSRQELVVYYKSRLYKTYHAVFGRNPDGSVKVFEGDRRTPEGAYSIISKDPSDRFVRFLRLDYPNGVDKMRYRESRAAREIPSVDGQLTGQGGRIGIHGTDDPRLNRTRVNWTTGCISLHNDDILELDALLPVGTSVVIRP